MKRFVWTFFEQQGYCIYIQSVLYSVFSLALAHNSGKKKRGKGWLITLGETTLAVSTFTFILGETTSAVP